MSLTATGAVLGHRATWRPNRPRGSRRSRTGVGCLQPRGDPLSDADGPPAVSSGLGAGHDLARAGARSRPSARPESQGGSRSGHDCVAMSSEVSCAPVLVGRKPGQRPRGLPRRPTRLGPLDELACAGDPADRGESHNAVVVENWGYLWICHSVALFGFYGFANWLLWRGVSDAGLTWPSSRSASVAGRRFSGS